MNIYKKISKLYLISKVVPMLFNQIAPLLKGHPKLTFCNHIKGLLIKA